MNVKITDPLMLPCGVEIPNRLCKAAMTEALADPQNRAGDQYLRLYDYWRAAEVGLSLSGNIHVDRRYLERAGNIAIDDNGGEAELQKLTQLVTADGTQFWAQISHAGRQSPGAICPEPIAPSPIQLNVKGADFRRPREITEAEIHDVIDRFVRAAQVCKRCGFTGVQIHSAHGYLLSSFLSPLTNQRKDKWGGSMQNRARLLREICAAVRETVGAGYPIAVKLNSADFQRGGFSEDESLQVLGMLDKLGVDLVEISGGNYEQTTVLFNNKDANGKVIRKSTVEREAYFLEYADKARQVWQRPLMITGGFRSKAVMEAALSKGELDMIGIARPLVCSPGCTARLLSGQVDSLPRYEDELVPVTPEQMPKIDEATRLTVNTFGHLGWFYMNLYHIGAGREPKLKASLLDALREHPVMDQAVIDQWDSPWV